MEIKIATKKDYKIVNELLLKLHNYHVENCPENFLPINIFFTKKEYKKRLKNRNIYFILYVDNIAAGIIGLNLYDNDFVKILFVNALYVEPQFRKQKVATTLMNSAFEYYKENCNTNKYCDYLNLNVAAFNDSAISFYEKMGFVFQSHNMGIKLK